MSVKIDSDMHVHTHLSACFSEPEIFAIQMLDRAELLGIKTVGFADHVWANPDITPSDWYAPQTLEQVSALRRELSSTDIPEGMDVLIGCEAETIAPGKFGITPEKAEQVDFVLLACTHTHMQNFVSQPPSDTPRAIATHMLEMFRSAAASGLATGIPHPMLPLGARDKFTEIINSVSDAEFEDAFAIAAENDVSIEITTAYLPVKYHWSREIPLRFLEIAKKAGCRFHFGSDAHDLERMNRLSELEYFATHLNLQAKDIKIFSPVHH